MRIRMVVAATVVWLLALGLAAYWPASDVPAAVSGLTFLSKEDLRGSMQGSSGIALDLNGDGDEDLVIGAPYAHWGRHGPTGSLLVYLSGPEGFSTPPSAVLKGDGNLGWSLVTLGSDFAAGGPSGSGEDVSLSGTVTLYQGGTKPQKTVVLAGENAFDKFGFSLATGDLNGDGFPDLIVGAPFHSPSPALYQQGAVYIYFGPEYDPAKAVKIPATSANGGIGFSVAAGDINGDGVDDLLLQASGKVIGYYGSRNSFVPNPGGPDVVFTSADAGFGKSIAVLGDLDGDGFKDVGVGANQATIAGVANSGRLFILKGGSGKRTVKADTDTPDVLAKIDGEPNGGLFASAVLPIADADGDGIPDLMVSAILADGNPWPVTGKIFFFSGSMLTAGATVVSARAVLGEAPNMHLGTFLASVAKGDRLAAGAPTENDNTGRVRLFDLR